MNLTTKFTADGLFLFLPFPKIQKCLQCRTHEPKGGWWIHATSGDTFCSTVCGYRHEEFLADLKT